MKIKIQYVLSIVALMLIISSCKKDGAATQNDVTPAFIAATNPGLIAMSISSLTIKQGSTASVSATLFNSNGDLASPQPTFVFTSNNTDAVTVSGSTLTGVSVGVSTLSVTDGSHGFAYCQVTVVDDTTTIPTAPANIRFSQGLINLNVSNNTTFTYTLLDASGNTVGGTATISVNPSTGVSISGNTITASKMGVYTVTATDGSGNPLSGTLTVVVNDPDAPSNITTCTGTDADWEVLSVKILNCPWFSKAGLTADPLRVEVTRRKKCDSHEIQVIQRSPESITVGFPGVVNLTDDGKLKSVKAGVSTIVAKVGGVASLAGVGMVMPHVEGNYIYSGSLGGSLSGTINLSFSWPTTILYAAITQNNQGWVGRLGYRMPSAVVSGCGMVGSDAYNVVGNGATTLQSYPDCNYNLSSGGAYFNGFNCGDYKHVKGFMGYFWLELRKANPLTVYDYIPIGIYGTAKGSEGSYTIHKIDGSGSSWGTLSAGGSPGGCTAVSCMYDNSLTNGTSRTWVNSGGDVQITFNKNGTGTIAITGGDTSGFNWSKGSGCNYPAYIQGNNYIIELVDNNTLILDGETYH